MNKEVVRKRNMELFGSLYADMALHDPSDKWKCFYCGQDGGTVDHQPPLSVIEDMVTSGLGFECVKVPACHHCNSLLGQFPSTTLSERFEELKEKLRKKYCKELRIQGQWTIEEILELGPGLRKMVLGSVALGEDAEARILYPGHRLRNQNSFWNDAMMRACPNCGYISYENPCPLCNH
jgi:hypothetical protein